MKKAKKKLINWPRVESALKKGESPKTVAKRMGFSVQSIYNRRKKSAHKVSAPAQRAPTIAEEAVATGFVNVPPKSLTDLERLRDHVISREKAEEQAIKDSTLYSLSGAELRELIRAIRLVEKYAL